MPRMQVPGENTEFTERRERFFEEKPIGLKIFSQLPQ
jgi:hypothetical protein